MAPSSRPKRRNGGVALAALFALATFATPAHALRVVGAFAEAHLANRVYRMNYLC